MTDFERSAASDDNECVETSAIKAAAAASSATYRSFADATRAVLDLLERHMPDATLFLAHLDRGQFIHRIVDTRKGGEFGLRSNLATPLGDAFCSHMAEDRAPRCATTSPAAGLRGLRCSSARRRSYLGVPLELSDGPASARVAALARRPARSSADDEQLFTMLARVLASELERESNERDLQRFNDMLRDQARGMGAVGRVAQALAGGDDARRAVCEAACEVAGAPVAFLLEPSGREFVSTAMAGVEIAAGDDPAARRRQAERPRVHRQGDLLRRRRAHAPGARRAAGRGDQRPLGGVRAGAARRRRSPAC